MLYTFVPHSADPDGNRLEFSIVNKPKWMWFNTRTGRLNGRPKWAQRNRTFSNIVIQVSDGVATRALPAFSITVGATSSGSFPIRISGAPAAVTIVGDAYEFQPSVTVPAGSAVTYTARNLPRWAAFDSASGRVFGTPTATDSGHYGGIVVSASTGSSTASLPPFAITVNTIVFGSATVSWLPPTETVEGQPATNLAGYKIYYGKSASKLSQVLDIPSPGITKALVESLPSGTWFFAVTAYTTAKEESEKSNLGHLTIRPQPN